MTGARRGAIVLLELPKGSALATLVVGGSSALLTAAVAAAVES